MSGLEEDFARTVRSAVRSSNWPPDLVSEAHAATSADIVVSVEAADERAIKRYQELRSCPDADPVEFLSAKIAAEAAVTRGYLRALLSQFRPPSDEPELGAR